MDDESRKLKRIKSIIRSIDGITEDNIIHVLDLNSAKKVLVEKEIDLMLLDLKIPELLGEESEQNEIAGLEFIDEIIGVEKYIKPKDIVIITEHDESLKTYSNTDKNISFPVLKYDESSKEWEKVIESKIKYGLICKTNRKIENLIHDFEVAIITAVEVETEAVRRLYESWEMIQIENDPTIYYKSEFYIGDRKCKLVTAQQSEMGMAAAATLSSKILQHFKPQFLIMVGIAAGIGEGKDFGDIIIANEAWNYSSGKYVCGGSGQALLNFLPEPQRISLNNKLLGQLSIDFSEVLFKIKKSWTDKINNELKVIIGPLACGTAVVANGEIVEQLIKPHSRKTVGLDMESYGMFYAVNNATGVDTVPLCIKSICDFADAKKGDGFQRYAAYTSSSFTKYLIENTLKFLRN